MNKKIETEITQEAAPVEAESVESTTAAAAVEKPSLLKRTPKWALIALPLLSVAAIAAVGGYGYARTHANNGQMAAAYPQMQDQANVAGADANANGPAGYAPVGYAPGYNYGPGYGQNGYGYNQGYGRGYGQGQGYGQGYGQGQGHGNMNSSFGFGGNMNGSGNSAANGGNGWNGNGGNGWM
jgi:hypothetical protein